MKINEKDLLANYFPEALAETKKLLAIPSFHQPAQPGMPYGPGTKSVLDYAINLGRKLGFNVHQDAQNRYGFLEYGEGEELFVILCHLDVVPPGNIEEWVTDPFTPIEQDGKLIGRGSFDDKGPTMMNLYALKYLKDNGFKPNYKIRMIFGLTEETTWESIQAYVADFGVATAGYVPDGEFPVVYAEKWIINYDIVGTLVTDFEIHGGTAFNVIADYVSYKGPKEAEIIAWLNQNNIKTEYKNGTLFVKGKSGHGSLPWVGVNAGTWLAKAMFEVGIHHPTTDYLAQNVHLDYNAHSVFGSLEDETGDLTQNLGVINIENGKQELKFNYRVPVFTKPDAFLTTLNNFITKVGLEGKHIATEDAVYVPRDSEIIQKMMKVYQEVTGDMEAKPLAIGGGTYAKAMPGIVAFGAEFDIKESTMHAYNEYANIADLEKMLEIYTKAIVLLTK